MSDRSDLKSSRFADEYWRPHPTIEQIIEAGGKAVRRALAIHKAMGVPAVVWENGQIVLVPPEELEELPAEEKGPVIYRPR